MTIYDNFWKTVWFQRDGFLSGMFLTNWLNSFYQSEEGIGALDQWEAEFKWEGESHLSIVRELRESDSDESLDKS